MVRVELGARVQNLFHRSSAGSDIERLRGVLEAPEVLHLAATLGAADSERPYGRDVILSTPELEAMVATWTRRRPCLPHTHGGAVGVVRVLRGHGIHRVWRLAHNRIDQTLEEAIAPGDTVVCPPRMLHSMEDAGGAEPLVTLHLYSPAIPHMVVYDPASGRTYQVDGRVGAWVPEALFILASYDELVDPLQPTSPALPPSYAGAPSAPPSP
jgi:hypothetical protein